MLNCKFMQIQHLLQREIQNTDICILPKLGTFSTLVKNYVTGKKYDIKYLNKSSRKQRSWTARERERQEELKSSEMNLNFSSLTNRFIGKFLRHCLHYYPTIFRVAKESAFLNRMELSRRYTENTHFGKRSQQFLFLK